MCMADGHEIKQMKIRARLLGCLSPFCRTSGQASPPHRATFRQRKDPPAHAEDGPLERAEWRQKQASEAKRGS
jgi:hypothetical protein